MQHVYVSRPNISFAHLWFYSCCKEVHVLERNIVHIQTSCVISILYTLCIRFLHFQSDKRHRHSPQFRPYTSDSHGRLSEKVG